jgi:hypothetical protein
MTLDEDAYIALCKEKIEKKFAFGNGNGYTQRDLESLACNIDEKTGINLSLSTLKRLWKGDFKHRPQIATLNGLAAVLDYKDWQEFKLKNQPSKIPQAHSSSMRPWQWVAIGVVAVTGFITVLNLPKRVKVNGPIHFTAEKTVTSGIPNTVIFKYDLANVEASQFFFQQSWNTDHRVAIDPNAKAFTTIYYEPGYHRAKLFANDSLIAMQPVHILSDGWEPNVYLNDEDSEPINFKNETFIEDGHMHLNKELLNKRNVTLSKSFYTRVSISQDFKLSSNNFRLLTRMKVDSISDKLCPWMQMTVVTEKNIFWISLRKKGCESYANYKTGEVYRSGENNDLSGLGVEIYDWQDVGITVENKNAKISINGKVVYHETYKEDFGIIKGLFYMFDGTGSLDYVRMDDMKGTNVFEDDFAH